MNYPAATDVNRHLWFNYYYYYGIMINPNKKWWLTDFSKRRPKSRIGMGPCDTYYPMDECMQKKYI